MARKKENERIRMTGIRKEQVLNRCGGICLHCGAELKLGENFSIEHVIPLSKGGDNSFENTVALCKECNFEKGDDVVAADFYEYAPKLVKESIENILNGYYEKYDWLAENNIFKHDRFSIEIEKMIQIPGSGKVLNKKSQAEVKKVSEEEYWRFVEEVPEAKTEARNYSDEATETIQVPINGSMYKVVSNGKPCLMFFIALAAGTGKGNGVNGRAVLRIIISVSSDIAWGFSAKNTTCDIVNKIIDEFVASMNAKQTKGIVMVCLDAPAQDKRASELIKLICEANETSPELLVDSGTREIAFYRSSILLGFGVDVERDEDGKLDIEDFAKKEKLYSGQLRRRLSRNA